MPLNTFCTLGALKKMNYERIYKNIVSSNYSLFEYVEKHHIIPRCVGGTDDDSNIVSLSAKAHYVAHHILTKIYPKNPKLMFAFNMMSVGHKGKRIYSYMHESNRRKHAENISMANKGCIAHNKGIPMSAKQKEKLSSLWKFVSPKGVEYITRGLREHCLEHKLNPSTMSAVQKGKRSHHKGWILYLFNEETKEFEKDEYINIPYPKGKIALNRQPISFRGVEYESKSACMKATGLYITKLNKLLELEKNCG